MIQEALRAHLTTTAGITALNGTRVYPQMRKQTADATAIVYNLISANHPTTLPLDDEAIEALYQIDIWCTTYSACQNIAAAIVASMHKLIGAFGDQSVELILLETERDNFEPEKPLYGKSLDFTIIYYEE